MVECIYNIKFCYILWQYYSYKAGTITEFGLIINMQGNLLRFFQFFSTELVQ